jgi:RNA polymerase sigma-70 factor (ECF subfamily)
MEHVRERAYPLNAPALPASAAEPTDRELVDRLRARDETALLALYRRYGTLVYSVALRTLGDAQDAEEVTQDVLLSLWKQPHVYDPARGSLGGWLAVMTRNAAVDRYRRRRRHEPAAELVSLDGTPALWDLLPGDEPGDPDLRRGLAALVGRLATEQREAIILAYIYGMSQTEIAQHLNRPLGTVKSHIRQGMERLRQLWTSQDLSGQWHDGS